MQLLIFFLLFDRKVLPSIDSLNTIPFTKKKVKHFFKTFLIFFTLCPFFLKVETKRTTRAKIRLYIEYVARERFVLGNHNENTKRAI